MPERPRANDASIPGRLSWDDEASQSAPVGVPRGNPWCETRVTGRKGAADERARFV